MSSQEKPIGSKFLMIRSPIKLDPTFFQKGLPVVNRSSKYIVYLDNAESERLVVPSTKSPTPTTLEEYEGLTFYNAKDSVWQCACGARGHALIINDISPEQAKALYKKQTELSGTRKQLGLEQARELVLFSQNELRADDLYYKGTSSIERDMQAVDPSIPQYVKVTSARRYKAVLLTGRFTYQGPVLQSYENGAVIVCDGKNSWAVEIGVFLNNYRALVGNSDRQLGSLDQEFNHKGRSYEASVLRA